MKLTTAAVIPATRDRVFAALVDPGVLHRCIPGCESMAATSAESYEAVLKIGVAGLKGRYVGKASIRDKVPPESLTLSFEGKGGPGFVRGTASIVLSDEGGGTRVVCETDVQVGGLIAAVGSRLVEAASKKLADDFFQRLSAALTDDHHA